MILNSLIVLLLFILFEGFYLLPEKFVVLIPGSFRLQDSIFFILPVFFLFFFPSFLRSLHRYGEEAKLVVAATVLVLLSPLMAYFFFGQPYYRGLLLMRHNLSYLTFFIFVLCLRPQEVDLDRMLRFLTLLIGIYILILILTKYFPSLPLIHYSENYYSESGMIRFDDFRLFFPHGTFYILFFCITLARLLYAPKTDSLRRKTLEFGFVLLVAYAILSTFTRILVFSLLAVTSYAFLTSKRPILKYLAVFMVSTVLFIQVVSIAASGSGLSFIEDSLLGKTVFQSGTLAPEEGRMFQFRMYLNNFLKSPLLGVGNIISGKLDYETNPYMQTYRKYGLFNASDLGYPKIAAESGLLGLVWVIWFYSYLNRRSRETLAEALALGNAPAAEAVARGLRYFLVYLLLSGITLAHFVVNNGIPVIVLTLALMAVTRESLQLRTATVSAADSGQPETNFRTEIACKTP